MGINIFTSWMTNLIGRRTSVGQRNHRILNRRLSNKNEIEQDALINPPVNVMPVVVDRISLDLLLNSKLVYQQDMMGEQFAIIDNPIADTGCGCGVSFGIKEGCKSVDCFC